MRAHICIRVKPSEKKYCLKQARKSGLSLSGWIRSKCDLDPKTPVVSGITYSDKYLMFALKRKEKRALQKDALKYGFTLSEAIRILCGIPGEI